MIPTTIAAIATPAGRGGIGIIRISGPLSFSIGACLFVSSQKRPAENTSRSFPYRSHYLYFGRIQNFKQTILLDEVLITFMRGPKTYTREDVVEIHCHSGHQTLQSILQAVFDAGAKPAEPGEFTRRAYLNGRIDLTQAESVIDLINARSEAARDIAFSQITGQLKKDITLLTDRLSGILAHMQAIIDFPEDIPDEIDLAQLSNEVASHAVHPIRKLIDNHRQSFSLASNFRAILVGAPNVGKSSLMNLLSRKQKSIVTPHPGTTRDLIEEYVQFSGAPMVLADTAGLHETDNAIETMGIDIAKQQIERADLILFVVEAGRPFTENERSIYRLFKEKPVILISNKTDLVSRSPAHSEPTDLSFYAIVSTSATQNTGVDRLQQAIETIVKDRLSVFTDPIVPNVRQTSLLESALESLSQFLDNLERQVPLDLLVLDLQETIGCLDAIIGNTVPTDVLDRIFGDFCIGK